MKKLLAFVLLILSLSVVSWGCGVQETNQDDPTIYWVSEESGFVDFEVSGDYVKFRYRICFINETRENMGIKLSASFAPEELAGWIEYNAFYDGLNNQGKWDYQTVNASGKTELVFTFQGKYLGGSINNSLSFPQELIVTTAAETNVRSLSFTDGSIQLSNGETYGYFHQESPSNVDFNGLIVETATLEQLLNRLDTSDISIPDYGKIHSVQVAAYCGADALMQRTPHWTSSDYIGVIYNETADVWIVHGMFYDRNNPGEAWAVVLEAETGKVLGFAQLDGVT